MSKKLYSFRLRPELMDALREQADGEGTSATDLLTRFIERGVAETSRGSESSHKGWSSSRSRPSNDQVIDKVNDLESEMRLMRQLLLSQQADAQEGAL